MGRAAALGLVALAMAGPASAQELVVGGFAHDVATPFSGRPHEGGTSDVEVSLRTPELDAAPRLRPRFYLKAEVNTDNRSSFYSAGVLLRAHVLSSRFYVQAGLGLAYDDGYANLPSPAAPGLSPEQMAERLALQARFKAMGSRLLFNPNLTVGFDLSRSLALEATWDHYSNAGLFGRGNPGMDNYGGALVFRFGQ